MENNDKTPARIPRKARIFHGVSAPRSKDDQTTLVYELIRGKLEGLYQQAQQSVLRQHRRFAEVLKERGATIDQFLANFRKVMATSVVASALYFLPTPVAQAPDQPRAPPHTLSQAQTESEKVNKVLTFRSVLGGVDHQPTLTQEQQLAQLTQELFGFKLTSELEGMRLNVNYGYMGAEQHLSRYPGDVLSGHFADQEQKDTFLEYGMAPLRGAWGYWARSRSELSQEDIEQEKWYVAVQTFLSPGWPAHYKEYYQWFRYRKIVAFNPQNGKGVVAVIGDAGPATWTGKVFGGSPEVMHALGLSEGPRKGAVTVFFVDDPDNNMTLGPLHLPIAPTDANLAMYVENEGP